MEEETQAYSNASLRRATTEDNRSYTAFLAKHNAWQKVTPRSLVPIYCGQQQTRPNSSMYYLLLVVRSTPSGDSVKLLVQVANVVDA